MPVLTCPTQDDLFAYAVGRLSDESSEAVAAHLRDCPDCVAGLATLNDVDDTFVARLRLSAGDNSYVEQSDFGAAAARARAGLVGSLPTESAMEGEGHPSGVLPDIDSHQLEFPHSLGEYQLLGEIGHGGMGTVYKALHTKLDRLVALKVLRLSRTKDKRAIARFEREMKAVGKLDHRHIVRAYDAREIEGTPTLVMEYVEGLDLGEILRRVGPLDVADACEVVRQAAIGLQYVHENGLVHRDIKPSNLMLSSLFSERGRGGEGPVVKILDLGLARFHLEPAPADEPAGATVAGAAEMTGTDQAMGTADYMAPEQASNSRKVDIRADIYSLGCTLFKLLTGRAPFDDAEHPGAPEKLAAHANEPAPAVRAMRPDVSEGLARVLDCMLAKDPAARFPNPAEVAAALAPYTDGTDLAALLAATTAGPASTEGPRSSAQEGDQNARKPRTLLASSLRKWIALALGLLLLSGSGFALAIILHIVKDNQTTTVELPEGSTTRIGADGQFSVELPRQPQEGPRQDLQQSSSPLRDRHFVLLVIGKDKMTFQGQETDLARLPGLLEKVPDRGHTVLSVGVAPNGVADEQRKAVFGWASSYVKALGFEYLSDVGVHPLGAKGPPTQQVRMGQSAPVGATQAKTASAAVSAIEFRIAPKASSLDASELTSYQDWLRAGRIGFWWKDGRIAGIAGRMPNHAWLPTAGSLTVAADLVAGEYQGKKYVLVSDKPGQKMTPGKDKDAWALESVAVSKDPNGRPEVRIRLDERGGALLSALTSANLRSHLAIIVEGKVVSDPIVQTTISRDAVITGNFSEQEVEGFVKTLLRNRDGASSAAAPGPTLSFGPVLERTVNDDNALVGNFLIDLDRGLLFTPPKELKDKAALTAWMTENGIDALAKRQRFFGIDMMVVPVPEEQWETITPESVREQLPAGKPNSPSLMGDGRLPAVYLFRTREGGTGILQIVEATDKPKGLKIRYKLVRQASNQATRPHRNDNIMLQPQQGA
jgi:serine/threonine protein kinase